MQKIFEMLSFQEPSHKVLYGIPQSYEAFALKELVQTSGRPILHVSRHEARMEMLAAFLRFMTPELAVLTFPAWDCLPYDRISPHRDIAAKRAEVLTKILSMKDPFVLLTTPSAFHQRIPPTEIYRKASLLLRAGENISLKALEDFFLSHGYARVGTVREPGEYAIRGGLLDLYPGGHEFPYRLDLFGDHLEPLKIFDPLTQRSGDSLPSLELTATSELSLTPDRVKRFRQTYRTLFGTGEKDLLYESVSAEKPFPGVEHWLPLFYESMANLLDYVPEVIVSFDDHAHDAARKRWEQIEEHYQARKDFEKGEVKGNQPYHPLAPDRLYIPLEEMNLRLQGCVTFSFSSFRSSREKEIDLQAKALIPFSSDLIQKEGSLLDALLKRLEDYQDKTVLLTFFTHASLSRMIRLFEDRSVPCDLIETGEVLESGRKGRIALALLPLEQGFETETLVVMTEQDLFGERRARPQKKKIRADLLIQEATTLEIGDLVVHQEHGIGRYEGLETLRVTNVPHDCICLGYEGGDKLYVPVENLEVLSRYGGEESAARLDTLGSAAWQHRKAKVKKKLLEMAEDLLQLAAERELQKGEVYPVSSGLYEEFSARFPYTETDDQQSAIADVLRDLESGRPMDRLICGDVGFGKTEIALRAAFVVASSGKQVAILTPTTLLARQHALHFKKRFEGFNLRIEELSRMVTPKRVKEVKEDIAKGQVEIVIGTHSLIAQSLHFKDLGLLIVDEEQHFGVKQKERLKELQKNVHILTLSATPIPRTLQMALSGVRDMSIIATPPVDRLAVRTFVLPFDPVIVREALLREHYRGGQSFYVAPFIEDLNPLKEQLRELVPEVRIAVAHGQIGAVALEKVMADFMEGTYDVLLATNIIESGLDIPRANTLLIHRADRFGLSQLYQLRGRVGRAKQRAYAYLTLPVKGVVSTNALKRLEVMQTLDTLGAGFQVASHDMDIRGTGNLLGEEQSGHIREIGVELYQTMLQEAIEDARSKHLGGPADIATSSWSPVINISLPVLIPETYVTDLSVRLNLYRRLSHLETQEDLDVFTGELLDRFGPLPEEVKNLLEIMALKQLCRKAHIERCDIGDKGIVVQFYQNSFPNPGALLSYIQTQKGTAKVRPDQKVVFIRPLQHRLQSLKTTIALVGEIASFL